MREKIGFRPITDNDIEFLYQLYASTRAEEMAQNDWNEQEQEAFLTMQFNLQHMQYLQNYKDASFDIIFLEQTPVGRLYVDRRENEIRILDIALLPGFRNQGIGTSIMEDLITEAKEKKLPLNLHVEISNPLARRFYEKLGFVEKKDIGSHFFMEIG